MARPPFFQPDIVRISIPPREPEPEPASQPDDETEEAPAPPAAASPEGAPSGASSPSPRDGEDCPGPPASDGPADHLRFPASGRGEVTNRRATPRQATSAAAFASEPPDPDDPLLAFAPVPHVAPRRNSITPNRQRAFIAHLAATGIVKQAALHIGASLEALYKLRNRPDAEGFRAAWDSALDRGVARLEDCALERAIQGEERPIASGGKLLGSYTRYDTGLILFLLRQRRPERFAAAPVQPRLKPGHPEYERIKREVLREDEMEHEGDLDAIDAWIEGIRERRLANEAILLEDRSGEDGEA